MLNDYIYNKKHAFNIFLIILILNNIYYISFVKLLEYDSPKISIFLPIYNKENYLKRSIESLESQTLKEIEIVAVNDASTDNSLKILKRMSKKDKRIKIINNDRNHGLLYSRAMGIINSSGQYLMNLDPDDKLVSSNNLKLLYHTIKSKHLDLIVYKIKRVTLNETEKDLFKYMDEIQFNTTDDHITNKLIKKSIFLKAYHAFKKEIHSFKWNFHEDNIWSILVKNFSNSSMNLNKFVYLYKRNEYSLNKQRGNANDLKSMIYRLKKYRKINQLDNIKKFNHHFLLMIRRYPFLKDYEIKNYIKHISVIYSKLYKKNLIEYKLINSALTKISDNKIIIFNNTNKYQIIKQLTKSIKFKSFLNNNRRRVLFINPNNETNLKNIKDYIFSNDIIIVYNNSINDFYIKEIIKCHNKKKIIIL